MHQVVNEYHVGYPDLDNRGVGFLVVLVFRDDGNYKCYSGMVALPEPGDPSYDAAREFCARRVALSGSPERYERARTFFPMLVRERYAS